MGSSTCWEQPTGFPQGAPTAGLSQESTTYTSSRLSEDNPWEELLVVVPLFPSVTPIPHYSQISMLHPPSQFGSGTFSLGFHREPLVEMRSRGVPYHPT